MKDILITSTVLIAAIVLLRYIFRSTIPRRVQYALWLLVALRLLVPVSIGNSGWSVAAMAGQLPEREISENILAVVGGDAPDLAPREPDPSLPEAEQQVLYQAYQQEWKDAVERAKIESGGTPITVQSILRIVWFIGMAVMALWFLAANLSFARSLRRTRIPLDGAESRYPVYLCDNIPSPCLFGLFHPAIYVTSAAAKDETRLRYVIAHEETHARHLDPLWSLVRGVCLVIWWFDPLVWLAAYCAEADCELACDEGTLARLGEVERVPYGETLLSLVPVRRGGNPLLTATTMTAGKRQMKERIQRIAEHKRPLAIALVVVLALTAIVCAATFTGAERNGSDAAEQIAADLPIAVDGQLDGAYASAEDYIDAVRAKITSATYYAADGSGEKTANVLDTRVALLQKRGEVSDLVPDGTLELYRYRLETKIDVPLADVALAGGMYAAEDGWCDLEGQGGHALIVLRRADGSADVLRDAPCNDDMGGIWHYQDSENEALYDWAVQYYDLDLPLYSVELSLGGQNKVPANRVDGDGWYVYIPARTWWYREDEGDTARWYSRYNTGSTISIREASREEMKADRPQLTAGRAERFVEASDGRIWLVWTQYDPSLLIRSDMTGLEPAVLDAMARSFTVIADASPQQTATTLPRYKYQGGDPYLAAVCEWSVKRGEQARYWEAQVTVPCPLIADVDDSDPQDIRVWGNFWSFSYTPRATTLFCVSGGENPGLLHLRPTENGYEVFNEEMVGDGEAYGKDMQRIFGALRLLKLDALDREEVRARFLDDYVSRNALPFTQYQDYGWDPVHIPGTPETPESAQRVRYAAPAGWSIDYDLREFSLHSFDENETGLSGVGDLEGISINFERYSGTTTEAVIAIRAEQMEQPTQMAAALGGIGATLLRDGATRGDVVKDTYVLTLNETDTLAVTVRNTYYGVSGDPVVQGGKEALEKTIKTFRLTAPDNQALWANASPETGDVWIAEHMTVAPALSPDRSDIAMELVSADGGAVTVALSNHGSEAFMYGEDFSLQVKLDGTWYVVPATPGENWGFPSTANILRPSETNEIACSLAMYGELPHGTYRIVKDGLAVEFTR